MTTHNNRKTSGLTFDDLTRNETLTCCLVCMEVYDKPRMLHCGHVFCHRCLLHHVKTFHSIPPQAEDPFLTCPTCQDQTKVSVDKLDSLALDRVDSTAVRSRKQSVVVNGARLQTCDPCESRLSKAEAEYYCSKCALDFCSACKAIHDQHSVFKSHSVIHISNKDSMNLYCSQTSHNKMACLYFCVDCSNPVCCMCIITEHNTHHTSKLSDALSTRRDNMKSLLNAVGPRVERLSARLRKLIHVCATSKPRAMSNGSTPPSTSNLEDGNNIEMVSISTRKDSNDNLDYEIRAIYSEVEKLHRLYDVASKILEIAQSRKLLVVYDELMARLQTVNDIELDTINDELVGKLEREIELSEGALPHHISPGQSTGSIPEKQASSHATTSNDSTPRHSNASQEDSYMDGTDQFMLFKPKLLWKLEKTRQDPGELWNPSGIAFRPNNSGVVVAEYDIMNDKNNRLRLFDEHGRTQGVLAQGLIKPLGVACNRDGNIAVTDCNAKRFKIYNKDGSLLQDLGKSQFGWPYGVTCNSKGQYIISDPFHDTIHIFNHDGRKVKTFGSSGSQSNQFKNPFHLTVDSRDNIIISDSGNNCIKVFDPQGHFILMSSDSQRGRQNMFMMQKQKSSKLKGPRGVAVDMKDNIIVADDCGRICLLDNSGKYVRNLLTEEDTVKYPEALATNRHGYLAVTEWNPNNMFAVKVFNMYE